MGCCQSTSEAGEIVIKIQLGADEMCGEEFNEVSLDSKEEETTCGRFNNVGGESGCRNTCYSLHRNEIEQSFLQTRLVEKDFK